MERAWTKFLLSTSFVLGALALFYLPLQFYGSLSFAQKANFAVSAIWTFCTAVVAFLSVFYQGPLLVLNCICSVVVFVTTSSAANNFYHSELYLRVYISIIFGLSLGLAVFHLLFSLLCLLQIHKNTGTKYDFLSEIQHPQSLSKWQIVAGTLTIFLTFAMAGCALSERYLTENIFSVKNDDAVASFILCCAFLSGLFQILIGIQKQMVEKCRKREIFGIIYLGLCISVLALGAVYSFLHGKGVFKKAYFAIAGPVIFVLALGCVLSCSRIKNDDEKIENNAPVFVVKMQGDKMFKK